MGTCEGSATQALDATRCGSFDFARRLASLRMTRHSVRGADQVQDSRVSRSGRIATDQKAVRRRGPGRVVLGSKPQLATAKKLVRWAGEQAAACDCQITRALGLASHRRNQPVRRCQCLPFERWSMMACSRVVRGTISERVVGIRPKTKWKTESSASRVPGTSSKRRWNWTMLELGARYSRNWSSISHDVHVASLPARSGKWSAKNVAAAWKDASHAAGLNGPDSGICTPSTRSP